MQVCFVVHNRGLRHIFVRLGASIPFISQVCFVVHGCGLRHFCVFRCLSPIEFCRCFVVARCFVCFGDSDCFSAGVLRRACCSVRLILQVCFVLRTLLFQVCFVGCSGGLRRFFVLRRLRPVGLADVYCCVWLLFAVCVFFVRFLAPPSVCVCVLCVCFESTIA